MFTYKTFQIIFKWPQSLSELAFLHVIFDCIQFSGVSSNICWKYIQNSLSIQFLGYQKFSMDIPLLLLAVSSGLLTFLLFELIRMFIISEPQGKRTVSMNFFKVCYLSIIQHFKCYYLLSIWIVMILTAETTHVY